MLMALWSLVWHWNEQGCPSVCSASAMPSFEGFSEVVGSIVMTAGFISPFTKRPATTDGGTSGGMPWNGCWWPLRTRYSRKRRKRPIRS